MDLMLLMSLMKVMMKPTKENIELVISSIIQANRMSHKLTAEDIIQRFPHAVQSFKYVRGQLKIKLHSIPKSTIPVDLI
jgi:hypothetical protein